MVNHSIIIMGVSGSGKSTLGKQLAERLRLPFHDADDFHPESNKTKMSNGTPLNDKDRKPWLLILKKLLDKEAPIVLACSALKKSYRQMLDPDSDCFWVYLHGTEELLLERMKQRQGHFMKPQMLKSQLETLEVPVNALTIDISKPIETILSEILKSLPKSMN